MIYIQRLKQTLESAFAVDKIISELRRGVFFWVRIEGMGDTEIIKEHLRKNTNCGDTETGKVIIDLVSEILNRRCDKFGDVVEHIKDVAILDEEIIEN